MYLLCFENKEFKSKLRYGIMQKICFVNPCFLGLGEGLLNVGTEKMRSYGEKKWEHINVTKGCGLRVYALLNIPLVCSRYICSCLRTNLVRRCSQHCRITGL